MSLKRCFLFEGLAHAPGLVREWVKQLVTETGTRSWRFREARLFTGCRCPRCEYAPESLALHVSENSWTGLRWNGMNGEFVKQYCWIFLYAVTMWKRNHNHFKGKLTSSEYTRIINATEADDEVYNASVRFFRSRDAALSKSRMVRIRISLLRPRRKISEKGAW